MPHCIPSHLSARSGGDEGEEVDAAEGNGVDEGHAGHVEVDPEGVKEPT